LEFFFSSPLFSIFSLVAILVGSRITGHNFEGGPPKDHSTKVWLQLAQWFLRRRLKCEMLKNVNNIRNLTLGKNDQHSKIYLPCNFEVNLITHLGVIALFFIKYLKF
jgi:hypothetical protein